MMARPFQFESFDAESTVRDGGPASPEFEAGVAAGIEAARASDTAQQLCKTEEALQVLSEMAFTYAEARNSILSALAPLFTAMIDHLLPALAHDSFAPRIVQALLDLAGQGADHPVDLRVNPAHVPIIQPLLDQSGLRAVRVIGDASLKPLQAEWRTPAVGALLDLSEMAEAIGTTVAALIVNPERKIRNAPHT